MLLFDTFIYKLSYREFSLSEYINSLFYITNQYLIIVIKFLVVI